MPRHPNDPLGLLSVAQAIPKDAVGVEVAPGVAVTIANQNPDLCPDPNYARLVLSVGMHYAALTSLDSLLGCALVIIDYQRKRIEKLEGVTIMVDPEREAMQPFFDRMDQAVQQIRENMTRVAAQQQNGRMA